MVDREKAKTGGKAENKGIDTPAPNRNDGRVSKSTTAPEKTAVNVPKRLEKALKRNYVAQKL